MEVGCWMGAGGMLWSGFRVGDGCDGIGDELKIKSSG